MGGSMSSHPQDHDEALLRQARALESDDRGVMACFSLAVRAIEVGWIDRDELGDLRAAVERGEDYGVQEFLIEHREDGLSVSLLDERYLCAPEAFRALLGQLARASGPSGAAGL